MDRLPPGQRLLSAEQFPVLDLGTRPAFDPEHYRFKVTGLVENPIDFTFAQLQELPATDFSADFHCVTKWSRFDIKWKGVLWAEIVKLVKPKAEARFVIEYGLDGYTTNVPLNELSKQNVALVHQLDGAPLPLEHGGPLRLIIPHLYGWKGSKFLTSLDFVAKDEPGFWEVRGYHNHGDPWKEERYS